MIRNINVNKIKNIGKKIVLVALTTTFLATSLTGCGKKEAPATPTFKEAVTSISDNSYLDEYLDSEVTVKIVNEEVSLYESMELLNTKLEVLELTKDFELDESLKLEEKIEYHTVVEGDTLIRIAEKYDTTVLKLKKDNDLTSDTICVGQVLKIIPTVNIIDVADVRIMLEQFNDVDNDKRIVYANLIDKAKKDANDWIFEYSDRIFIKALLAVIKSTTIDELGGSMEWINRVTINSYDDAKEGADIIIENYDVDKKGKAINLELETADKTEALISMLYDLQGEHVITPEVVQDRYTTIVEYLGEDHEIKNTGFLFFKEKTLK